MVKLEIGGDFWNIMGFDFNLSRPSLRVRPANPQEVPTLLVGWHSLSGNAGAA